MKDTNVNISKVSKTLVVQNIKSIEYVKSIWNETIDSVGNLANVNRESNFENCQHLENANNIRNVPRRTVQKCENVNNGKN